MVKFRRLFDLDTRSLALFRIVIGTTLLVDFICDFIDAEGLYTRTGAMPRYLWAEMYEYNSLWCLHILNDSLFFIRSFLLVQMGLAVMLIVGWRTRLATALSWIFFVSLCNRNVLATDGGDQIGSYLLFAAIFLPLGDFASLDSKGETKNYRVAGFGSILFISQMFLMYFCAGISKLQEAIWWNGNAMDTVLRWTEYTKPMANVFLRSPLATKAVSYATPWLELFIPFFLIFNDKQRVLRVLAIVAFIVLHLFIDVSLRLTFFSVYSWAGLLALLPTEFWDWTLKNKHSDSILILEAKTGCEKALRALALVLVFSSAYSAIPAIWRDGQVPYPSLIANVNDFTYGYQNWNLFREPQQISGWYRAKAELHSGRTVDLFQEGAPYSDAKPSVTSAQFPSRRWLSFMMHVQGVWDVPMLRALFARYFAERWDRAHSPVDKVEKLEVIYYREDHPVFQPDVYVEPYSYALYQEGNSDVVQP